MSRHIAYASLSILHRSSAVYRFVVSFKQKICQGKILPGIKSYFKNDLIYSSSAVLYKPPPAVIDHIKLLLIMLNHHIVIRKAPLNPSLSIEKNLDCDKDGNRIAESKVGAGMTAHDAPYVTLMFSNLLMLLKFGRSIDSLLLYCVCLVVV